MKLQKQNVGQCSCCYSIFGRSSSLRLCYHQGQSVSQTHIIFLWINFQYKKWPLMVHILSYDQGLSFLFTESDATADIIDTGAMIFMFLPNKIIALKLPITFICYVVFYHLILNVLFLKKNSDNRYALYFRWRELKQLTLVYSG